MLARGLRKRLSLNHHPAPRKPQHFGNRETGARFLATRMQKPAYGRGARKSSYIPAGIPRRPSLPARRVAGSGRLEADNAQPPPAEGRPCASATKRDGRELPAPDSKLAVTGSFRAGNGCTQKKSWPTAWALGARRIPQAGAWNSALHQMFVCDWFRVQDRRQRNEVGEDTFSRRVQRCDAGRFSRDGFCGSRLQRRCLLAYA